MRKLEVVTRKLGLDLLHDATGVYTVINTKDCDYMDFVDCNTINLWEDIDTILVKGKSPHVVEKVSKEFELNGYEFILEYRVYSELEVEGWELCRTTIVHP